VADREVARRERVALRALLQLAFERAVAHVVDQEERARAELHAAGLLRRRRLLRVAPAVVVGQRAGADGQRRGADGQGSDECGHGVLQRLLAAPTDLPGCRRRPR
jgi:hypothetical protein